ncbi:phage tail protein [Salmonella enterica subsp. enterica serovar Bovismorbificans]|uniref:Phage tail protein n=1 Tax=Salmonella enterica subsp. enterica serovar Bovismorbificans TaxID=58097 RepID=A0A5X5VM32_SALET|nr:prophage tail fiber N-terminal domain-containing protein [Salmonella enterica]EAA5093976.1 phage tail protein [Salmonella enterica subsp. enterica serovar Bovismorbificans]ECR2242716.1 phage tail protein [Salmonella enterica subsp. enterica]EAA7117884.1 phage tail protein [Salmonella enterica subsp. enterica serovar Bovismorbificans]EBG5420793.1 phage tail protein [Salmonella enterica subsp. enterica serovar Bovismorbificans]EBM0421329.1 phage tail protein [Salmonella enterica]
MSVLISGALVDGAGIPLSGCHIILKSRVNTSEVVMRTIADVVTGNNGEYSFEAQAGKYCVYLKQDWRDEYCVGDISVYHDAKPGTLNDFLTALSEDDLKPDVVRRFEEMVAQAQQSAEAAALSEQNAKNHADNAAGSAQQTAQDVTAATTARQDAERFANEAKNSAQEARGYRDSAQQIVDGLNATNATTTEKGLVQLCSATDNDSEALAATPKAVKTVMDEVKEKAPLNSPALAGTPTTPTPDLSATGREIANAAFVRALIAALVGSVPETLDTLKELADALGNDPNFATTMTNALAGKQPLSDVLTSLSSLPATGNKMPYFSDKNVMALANLTAVGRELTGQNSKGEVLDYLGLKGAATKDVQTDIYDRTPERVAMPGAFGYGAFFRTIKMFSADKGPSEFLPWVKSNPPGQYAVSQYGGNGYKPILEGVVFDGIVEIKIPGTVVSNESHHIKDKLVIFYGSNGEVYHNRLIVNSISGDRFRGWRNWLLGADGIANTLSSLRGSGYGYPDIGGVVLAAYCGTSDTDSSRKFYRGVRVPGSRLAVISVTAACNTGGPYASTPQVVVASPGLCPMAGTFTALSGLPGNSGGTTTAMIGLFVRTA